NGIALCNVLFVNTRVTLCSAGGVTQGAGLISAFCLLVKSACSVTLCGGNRVQTVAANVTGTGKNFSFLDGNGFCFARGNGLIVGCIGGQPGIKVKCGSVRITAP